MTAMDPFSCALCTLICDASLRAFRLGPVGEAQFRCVVLVGLELTVEPRLASNS